MNMAEKSIVCAVLVLSACTSAGPTSRTVIVRDSAGIRIVENGPLSDVVAFRLEEPVYQVGWSSADHLWERVGAGVLLSGGHAGIGDVGSSEIVVLGPSGAVVEILGGPGQGPGEIGSIRSLSLVGLDTIVVEDYRNRRITLFHAGAVTRSYRTDGRAVSGLRGIGTDGHGGLIMTTSQYWPFSEDPWIQAVIARHALDTGETDTVAFFDSWPGLTEGVTPNPFRSQGWAGVTAGALATTRGDRPQMERLDLNGNVTHAVRWVEERKPANDSVWRDYEEFRRSLEPLFANSPEQDRVLADLRGAAEGPLPYSGWIRGDDAGNVWVAEYAADWRYPSRFRVFSPTGEWLGWVEVPPRFEVLDIGQGYLLGVHRDEFDVAAIALYRLQP